MQPIRAEWIETNYKNKELQRSPNHKRKATREEKLQAKIIISGSIADLVHIAQVCDVNRMEIRHWMKAVFSTLAAVSLERSGMPIMTRNILNLPYLDTLSEPYRKISREEFINLLIDSAEAASCKDFKWKVKRLNFEDEGIIVEMGSLYWDRNTKWETLKS